MVPYPQGGVAVGAAGAGGPLRAVLTEVPGECPPRPGTRGRAAGPTAVPTREPGAQRPQSGEPMLKLGARPQLQGGPKSL